jgi:hypothetical protein
MCTEFHSTTLQGLQPRYSIMGPAMQDVASLEQGAQMDAIRCSPEFLRLINPGVVATPERGHQEIFPSPRECGTSVGEGGGGLVSGGESWYHQGGMQWQQEYLSSRGWRVVSSQRESARETESERERENAHDPNTAAGHVVDGGGALGRSLREEVRAGDVGGQHQRASLVFDLFMSEEELQKSAVQETEAKDHSTTHLDASGLEDQSKPGPVSCFSCFCSR